MSSIDDGRIAEFGLLHEGYRSLLASLERELAAKDLGPFVWHEVLLRLVRSPGERLPVTVLAQQVLIPVGSFTRVLDRMEEAGLIERRPSPANRRSTLVTLTAAGRRRARRSAAVSVDCLQTHAFDHLSDAERTQLSAVMGKIRAANAGSDD